MKSFVSSLSLVLVCSLVLGCGGGDGAPGADAGEEEDAALGPAPTLSYPSHAYTFLSPGTDIPPILPTATASGFMTFTVEGDLPVDLDANTGELWGPFVGDLDAPDGTTMDVVITLTDEADRKVEWPITFTLKTTAETMHTIDVDTSCAECAVPSPESLSGVHVGDFIVFSTQPGGEATIDFDFSLPLALTAARNPVRIGINSGAGTTISYVTGSGDERWGGSIEIVE